VTVPTGVRYEHGREWSAATLAGPGKAENADALAISLKGPLLAFAVADGVGAMPTSPLASALASTAAAEWIAARETFTAEDAKALYGAANDAVAKGLKGQQDSGATTLVIAVVGAGQLIVTSLGDSEVLAVGVDGPAQSLLPRDHHPSRTNMLLAWLDGVAQFDSHVLTLDALPHRLVLATDGVAGTLREDAIAEIVRSLPPSEAAMTLVMRARAAGSSDDATAIVIGDGVAAEAPPGAAMTLLNSLGETAAAETSQMTERRPRR
jgi:serine/threonine protein phosphatase PrpC